MAKSTLPGRGGKAIQVKVRSITRSMTSATLLAQLPRGSRVLGFILMGTASTAGTTATLSLGNTTAATQYVNAANVLATGTAPVGNGVNVLPGVAGATGTYTRANAGIPIYALYAETGSASGAGAWTVAIMYTTGNFEDDDTQ